MGPAVWTLALAALGTAVAAPAPFTVVANVQSHTVIVGSGHGQPPQVNVTCTPHPGLRCRAHVDGKRVIINVFHDPSTIYNKNPDDVEDIDVTETPGREDNDNSQDTSTYSQNPSLDDSQHEVIPHRISQQSNEFSSKNENRKWDSQEDNNPQDNEDVQERHSNESPQENRSEDHQPLYYPNVDEENTVDVEGNQKDTSDNDQENTMDEVIDTIEENHSVYSREYDEQPNKSSNKHRSDEKENDDGVNDNDSHSNYKQGNDYTDANANSVENNSEDQNANSDTNNEVKSQEIVSFWGRR